VLLVVLNLVWGGTYAVTKLGLAGFGPWTLAWVRYTLAALVLIPVALVIQRRQPIPRAQLRRIFVLGFFAVGFNQGLQIAGLHLAGATDAALLVANEPVFTAVVAWLILRESFGLRKGAGFLAAVLGAALVVTRGNPLQLSPDHVVGDLLIVAGVTMEAFNTVLSKRIIARHAPLTFTTVLLCGAAVSSALPAAWESAHHPPTLGWGPVLAALYLGVLASTVCYSIWYIVLRDLPAGEVAASVFLQPIVGVGLAALLVGERPVPADYLGAGLVFVGVGLVIGLGRHAPLELETEPTGIITPAAAAGGRAPE
jgi:drug/metabolite transporter (DMT)-like permease